MIYRSANRRGDKWESSVLVFSRLLICFVVATSPLSASLFAAQGEVQTSSNLHFAQGGAAAPPRPQGTGKRQGPVVPTGGAQNPDGQKTKSTGSLRQLELGDVYFKEGEWDAAIERYQRAAESPDEKLATTARSQLARAVAHRNAEPLGLREALPPPINHWWFLDYGFLLLLLLVFLPIILKLVGFVSRGLILFLRPKKSHANWRVVVSGSAEEPQRSLVFDELIVTSEKIKALRSSFGGRGIGTLARDDKQGSFVYPMSLTGLAESGLVVKGVDLGRLATFLQALAEHYSYRLELRVDHDNSSAYVFASLRWGAQTEEVWQIPEMNSPTTFGFREIGRLLAYEIYGKGMVRQ